MSSVLFDDARAARRCAASASPALCTVLVLLVVAGAGRCASSQVEGQLTAEMWEPFVTPDYVEALLEGVLDDDPHARRWRSCSSIVVRRRSSPSGGCRSALWLRWPSTLVVEFFRAVPLLMLILAIYLIYGDVLGKFWSLVIGLMLYNGSVLAEVFRAGVLAVPRGQSEAAYADRAAHGARSMRLVLLPQAVRIMLPAIISQSVVALKDTSLGYVIPYEELPCSPGRRSRSSSTTTSPPRSCWRRCSSSSTTRCPGWPSGSSAG